MTTLRPKILFLAIDAGDSRLIRRWAADGTLPTMSSLLSRGLVGETVSVEGLYEGATWPSFSTGVNPARHAFHRLSQIEPGTYEFCRRYPAESMKQEPFWVTLSRAGRRVAVLDVPLTGISESLNGIQTVEWGSHDAAYGFRAWPAALGREIVYLVGQHPLDGGCDSRGRTIRGFRRFEERLIEGVRKKTELTLHFLAQGDWDFCGQVFTEAHCAGHQCWHLHDPLHPDHDPKVAARTGDPLRAVYQAIDAALGEILTRADDGTLVLVLASHGMAHNVGADFLLEDILEELGFLVRSPVETSRLARPGARIIPLARAAWEKLPAGGRRFLKPVLSPLYDAAFRRGSSGETPQFSPSLDFERSVCLPHPNGGLVSGIRVNLLGREPRGIVKPGDEVDAVFRKLTAGFLSLTHQASGLPMVKQVLRTDELFAGPYLDHLPDFLVEWNDEVRIASATVGDHPSSYVRLGAQGMGPHGGSGLIEGRYSYCRTGDHRPYGLFAATGPGISSGTVARTVSIMDFAPTFLRWLGLPGDDLDGTAIEALAAD